MPEFEIIIHFFANNVFTSREKIYFCTPFKKMFTKFKFYGTTQIV